MKLPNEPKFTGEASKMQLIQGLGFYAFNSEPQYSKAWAIEWAKHHLTAPELIDKLHKVDELEFKNRGYLCRMTTRGLVLTEKQRTDLEAFLRALKPKREQVVAEKKVVKPFQPKVKAHVPNAVMQALDPFIDDIMSFRRTELPPIPNGNPKDVNAAVAYYENLLHEMKEYPEYFIRDHITVLKKAAKVILEALGKIVEKQVKLKTVKVVTTTRKINPAKLVKGVKYMREEPKLKLRSMSMTSIIGAKKLYAYDTKTRQLMVFVASIGSGFSFSGATLKNYDPTKSVKKTLRKPEDFFNKYNESANISTINKMFGLVNGKELPIATGRSNENIIYLITS